MGIFDDIKSIFIKSNVETKQGPMVMMQNVGHSYSKKDKVIDEINELR